MGNWRTDSRGYWTSVFPDIPQHNHPIQSVWHHLSLASNYEEMTNPNRYLQMSGMILGGMIEADHRLRLYEYQMRMQRRVMREQAKWERYEEEFGKGDGK